uniref:Uncharacterized protein n=1 Tax=Chromera velia CCMP2878 TaxID=1169474 RepID=A0A0G4I0W5_9ALVE|eukprot:Cvel_10052.t1-p1 / transcript=Cvel_10052.t1 / gene=Cvel_10052 / organism=Chromera_velia_CCMP2878 / gene_product=hypothetical protein / transcript_product=hypothetical protein / location=Cvel_scaffold598:27151-33552(+) / protein_length=893 / sequence_SO=supercontig / SO=protein_coding / is_pseudo=false
MAEQLSPLRSAGGDAPTSGLDVTGTVKKQKHTENEDTRVMMEEEDQENVARASVVVAENDSFPRSCGKTKEEEGPKTPGREGQEEQSEDRTAPLTVCTLKRAASRSPKKEKETEGDEQENPSDSPPPVTTCKKRKSISRALQPSTDGTAHSPVGALSFDSLQSPLDPPTNGDGGQQEGDVEMEDARAEGKEGQKDGVAASEVSADDSASAQENEHPGNPPLGKSKQQHRTAALPPRPNPALPPHRKPTTETSEERELRRIQEEKAQMAKLREKNARTMARGHVPFHPAQRSLKPLTIPNEPQFRTDSRMRSRPPSECGSETEDTKPTNGGNNDNTWQPKLTQPKPFTFRTDTRGGPIQGKETGDEHATHTSLQEQLHKSFEGQLRGGPAPSAADAAAGEGCMKDRRGPQKEDVTQPEPFQFQSESRTRRALKILSSQEREEIECAKQFKAMPLNPAVLTGNGALGLPRSVARPTTEAAPPSLHLDQRSKVWGTKEAQEREKEAKALKDSQTFHARPLNEKMLHAKACPPRPAPKAPVEPKSPQLQTKKREEEKELKSEQASETRSEAASEKWHALRVPDYSNDPLHFYQDRQKLKHLKGLGSGTGGDTIHSFASSFQGGEGDALSVSEAGTARSISSEVREFRLATELRGKDKTARARAEREEEERAEAEKRQFRARPAPASLELSMEEAAALAHAHHAPLKDKKPTNPQPFTLLSDCRGHLSELREKDEREREEFERLANTHFVARPFVDVHPPAPPKKTATERAPLKQEPFDLASDKRPAAWVEIEERRRKREEEEKMEVEKMKATVEEAAARERERALQMASSFKARPAPLPVEPPAPVKCTKPPTEPKAPQFRTDARGKLPRVGEKTPGGAGLSSSSSSSLASGKTKKK